MGRDARRAEVTVWHGNNQKNTKSSKLRPTSYGQRLIAGAKKKATPLTARATPMIGGPGGSASWLVPSASKGSSGRPEKQRYCPGL